MENSAPCCENQHHHQGLSALLEREGEKEELLRLAELFKVFSDPGRLMILSFLSKREELCVCDLSQLLSVSVSAVSHQLRLLKQSRLVKFRREGKTVYYSLADDHVRTIMAQGMAHINE